jgi:hypothetical protein
VGIAIQQTKGWREPMDLILLKETLINSEFAQHKDALPFSMTNKSLKMKKKGKSHFLFLVL